MMQHDRWILKSENENSIRGELVFVGLFLEKAMVEKALIQSKDFILH